MPKFILGQTIYYGVPEHKRVIETKIVGIHHCFRPADYVYVLADNTSVLHGEDQLFISLSECFHKKYIDK